LYHSEREAKRDTEGEMGKRKMVLHSRDEEIVVPDLILEISRQRCHSQRWIPLHLSREILRVELRYGGCLKYKRARTDSNRDCPGVRDRIDKTTNKNRNKRSKQKWFESDPCSFTLPRMLDTKHACENSMIKKAGEHRHRC